MALYSKRISLLLLLLLLLNLTELSITPHTPFSSSEVVHGQLRKKPPGVASSGAAKTLWRSSCSVACWEILIATFRVIVLQHRTTK